VIRWAWGPRADPVDQLLSRAGLQHSAGGWWGTASTWDLWGGLGITVLLLQISVSPLVLSTAFTPTLRGTWASGSRTHVGLSRCKSAAVRLLPAVLDLTFSGLPCQSLFGPLPSNFPNFHAAFLPFPSLRV
jgi:hypothetical protein